MLAITIFTLLALALLTPSTDYRRIEQGLYSLLSTSLLIAVSTVGLLSLLFLRLELGWLPMWSIGLTLSIYIIAKRRRYLHAAIKASKEQLLLARSLLSEKSIANTSVILLLLFITMASFGPINHPDAADYHTGYALQFWIQNKVIVDGGLTEGLLGFGDLGNFSFYQEGSSWLIRTLPIVNIFPVIFYLTRRGSNKILLLVFLSLPIFIQWITIGKPLLLTDTSIFLSYATWVEKRSSLNAKLTIACCLLSLGFKVTSLLVIIPILIHIFAANCNYNKSIRFVIAWLISSKLLVYTTGSIIVLAIFRYQITGNPLYPLFSTLITPNDWQKIWFENMLGDSASYPSHFPISLAIPFSIQHIGIVLGPAVIVALIICIASAKSPIQKNIALVAISQLVILIFAGPKRADYYALPILLLIYCESYSTILPNIQSKSFGYRLLSFVFLPFQITIALGLMAMTIVQTGYSYIDYKNAMNRFAWGFSLYQTIIDNTKGRRYVNLVGRNLRNYSGANYIDKDKFEKCLGKTSDQIYKSIQAESKPYLKCMNTLNVEYIASQKDLSEVSKYFRCEKYSIIKTSRNPFNLRKQIIYICNATANKES